MLGIARNPDWGVAAPGPKFWLWPNLLSLDAPFVAVLWQILFLRCFHAAEDAPPAILLVTSVWLIYAADRVLDAWRGECALPRHRFYRAHWRLLLPIWIAVLAASAWLALTRLPAALLQHGLALLAAVAAYFAIVHGVRWTSRAKWPKEASVGLLFALGASLAAWSNVRGIADAAAIALFFMLCWINCAAIQKWESSEWARHIDWSALDWPVSRASLGVALVAGLLLCLHRPILGGAEMASALAFVALDRFVGRLSPDALRVLADVALLSPVVFLPLVKGV
jgi:hypothetical protein